ncbi:hypothetical protein D9M68_977320 [compost metagenome]
MTTAGTPWDFRAATNPALIMTQEPNAGGIEASVRLAVSTMTSGKVIWYPAYSL